MCLLIKITYLVLIRRKGREMLHLCRIFFESSFRNYGNLRSVGGLMYTHDRTINLQSDYNL